MLMVAHVVLLTPRPDLSQADRQTFARTFKDAMRVIPSVRNVKIGRRLLHGAGYEQRAALAPAYVAIIEFDDLAGLQEYLAHPAHRDLGAGFRQSFNLAAAYDFELGGLEELESYAPTD